MAEGISEFAGLGGDDESLSPVPERCFGCPNRLMAGNEFEKVIADKSKALAVALAALNIDDLRPAAEAFVGDLSEFFGPPPEGLDVVGSLLGSIPDTAEGMLTAIDDKLQEILEHWAHMNEVCDGMAKVYVRHGLGKKVVGEVCGHDLVCGSGSGGITPMVLI